MNTAFQFEISHKSGTVDCFTVNAYSLLAAWRHAERLSGAGTITTARVRAPDALGDTYWHSLTEAKKLDHIARTVAR